MGPARSANVPSRGDSTYVPVMSAGKRSGVNWIRLTVHPSAAAKAFTSVVFAIAASGGYTIAIVVLSLVRERVELSDVPSLAKGAALTLVLAAILSMAFMGFGGMGTGQ